jgi:hypothetical protein
MVMIIFPAWVVVSAHGSDMDWKRGSGVADHFNYLEQIAGGAGQAIELPDGYDVTFAKLIKHPAQFASVTICPGDFFAEDTCATGLLERIELKS